MQKTKTWLQVFHNVNAILTQVYFLLIFPNHILNYQKKFPLLFKTYNNFIWIVFHIVYIDVNRTLYNQGAHIYFAKKITFFFTEHHCINNACKHMHVYYVAFIHFTFFGA